MGGKPTSGVRTVVSVGIKKCFFRCRAPRGHQERGHTSCVHKQRKPRAQPEDVRFGQETSSPRLRELPRQQPSGVHRRGPQGVRGSGKLVWGGIET